MKIQELFHDIRNAQAKCKYLIDYALQIPTESNDRALVLTKIKQCFDGLGPVAKRQANNQLLAIIKRMEQKLVKDKDLLVKAMIGLDGTKIREWTNQRIGKKIRLYNFLSLTLRGSFCGPQVPPVEVYSSSTKGGDLVDYVSLRGEPPRHVHCR